MASRDPTEILGHHESSCAVKYHAIRSRAAGRLARELIDADIAAKQPADPVTPKGGSERIRSDGWSADEIARAETLRGDGKSVAEIADRLGRTEGSVATKLSRIRRDRGKIIGAPPLKSRTAWCEDDVAEVIRLREEEKLTWAEIDRRMNRPSGSSCYKYESLRRPKVDVSKYGGGGRIKPPARSPAVEYATLTAAFFKDPPPGRSALDKMRAGLVEDLPPSNHREVYYASRPKITLATEPMR
jgi:transposase